MIFTKSVQAMSVVAFGNTQNAMSSFNIASMTGNPVKDVVFTTPLKDINYVVTGSPSMAAAGTNPPFLVYNKTVNGFSINTNNSSQAFDFVVFN